MTSLRLPIEWHKSIAQVANRLDRSPAYVYRAAIRHFIERDIFKEGSSAIPVDGVPSITNHTSPIAEQMSHVEPVR
jgi:hypothetical protein